MIENLKKNWPLLLLVAACLLFPANQGPIIAIVVFAWVFGWGARLDTVNGVVPFLTSIALVIFNVSAIVDMETWHLGFWQGYFPLTLAATVAFFTAWAVNKK